MVDRTRKAARPARPVKPAAPQAPGAAGVKSAAGASSATGAGSAGGAGHESPRLDEMAVFVDVVRAGSVSAAARMAGVPKSTVSRAMRRLEASLGTALLRRLGRGEQLTAAGERLAGLVGAPVQALREAPRQLAAGGEPAGRLRITTSPDLGQALLGPILPAFSQRYPHVQVEVDLSLRLVDLVSEGYDAALRTAPRGLASSSMLAKKIGTIAMHLYASPAYLRRVKRPTRLSHLAEHELIGFFGRDRSIAPTLRGPQGSMVYTTPDARLSGNNVYFVRELLLAGGGIGPLPAYVARPEVEAGRLERVLPTHGDECAGVYFVHPPLRPVPRPVELLRDFVLEHAEARLR